jgi:site-specific DNA recombinase
LAATEHDLASIGTAIDRYLAKFENGTLDPEDLAARLAMLKARSAQPRARHDERASQVAAVPTAPPAATLRQVAEHIADIVASGSHSQRKALVEALIAQIKITGPGRTHRLAQQPPAPQPKIRFVHWPIWWGVRGSNPEPTD